MNYVVAFLSCLLCCTAFGQQVTFRVTDEQTGKPIPDAYLTEGPSNRSNANGYFTVAGLKKKQTLTFSAASYELGYFFYERGPDTISVALYPDTSLLNARWAKEDEAYGPLELAVPTNFPDTTAQFPGGEAALRLWISKNVSYPKRSIERGDWGKVYVRFIVETDGMVSNVHILKGASPELNRAALVMCRKMPRWKPAVYKGGPVRSLAIVPVTYMLR